MRSVALFIKMKLFSICLVYYIIMYVWTCIRQVPAYATCSTNPEAQSFGASDEQLYPYPITH